MKGNLSLFNALHWRTDKPKKFHHPETPESSKKW